jgi:predicted Zn-dependent protease
MENRVTRMPYRQVLDSVDFRYARAKLRADAGQPADAVRDLESEVARAPQAEEMAYGLARALLRAGRADDALVRLDVVRKRAPASPWLETLAAEIHIARRDGAEAVRILDAARRQFPASRSVAYALADARIQAGQAGEAAKAVRRLLDDRSGDPRLWQLLSRAHAALGERSAQHRAQAEVYVLRGSLPAAIEQLEIARKAGDGDFYLLSAVDARLRELQRSLQEARRQQ